MNKDRILHIFAVAILACFAFGAAQARADVYMKQKVHTGAFQVMGQTQPEKDEIMIFWLGANAARTDHENGTTMIFLGDKKVLYMIDNNKQTYAEMPMDFDKMFEAAATEAGAGEDPEKAEAMKKMPGFMKNMMKGMMGNMSAKVTETGETKKIGSWDCRKYLVEMDMGMGTSSAETWATEDLRIDYSLAFTMANAMMAGQPGFEKIVQEMKKIKGVVVLQTATVKMMGSEVTTATELLECVDKGVPAGNYDVPAGYKKVKGIKK